MPEKTHVRFTEGVDASISNRPLASPHAAVSSLGKKRKRPESEPASTSSTQHAFPSADSRPQKIQPSSTQAANGVTLSNGKSDDGRGTLSQRVNGDEQTATTKRKIKPSTRQTPVRNGSNASQQHRASSLAEKKKALLELRQKLPIWAHADKIRRSLRAAGADVLLLVGETGSGKSTQVPQFLMDEAWCDGRIAITQPRRVAAISLARRVADEMGTPLGSSSPASKVGYSVRFDTSVSPATKIKFLTEGMLLQELLRDPWLKQYSAVIVDEVHERSVNVDLILGFLRNLVCADKRARNGKPLKVVVMSATADVQKLHDFFEAGRSLSAKLASGEGQEDNASEASWRGLSDDENGDKNDAAAADGNRRVSAANSSSKSQSSSNPAQSTSVCYIEGRQFPVQITYLSQPTQDFVEAALKAVFQIHLKEPLPGDILVFLTGQDTVESLERLINEYAETMDPSIPKILALPLFAALPQSAQQRVFLPAPPRTRKIVLSTNIAETSVTVPGVRYVVDSGKHKIKQFRNKLGLDSLLVKPISKSSAIQRTGRAGREAPGKCVRLFTEKDYEALEKTAKPEILRCDLAQAIVTMKARGVDDVVGFPWLDPPPREALEKALMQLFHLGALDENGQITDIGRTIAKLPLTPTLGRVLVEAARPERDCLPEMIDIVAALSVENIFLNVMSEEKREEAEAARAELYRREGDHLTLLATVRSYASENTDRKKWAAKYFVSHRAMQNVMDIRKQLTQLCIGLDMLAKDDIALDRDASASAPSEALSTAILQCIVRGFASNTARLVPDGSYRTLMGNQTVAIHPSSVLFGKKVEAIVFTEFVFTNKSYARGCSAVRLAWIDEVLRAL
ncbi:uncharacterized protein PV09_05892 [Verruconis gallopava]|uniref:RNA helicase n=1 Tax=Verruconis gallopava TaxID=253628 RepID=A0A0D2A8B1_9PEZI|nr:uncharacterized protein PV09_05892 [Verruconis gallopava]KIW02835.1 hypothetical protein PV09_05892 [Verruconis gallopava]